MPSHLDRDSWGNFLSRCPEAHLLQSSAWGELKAGYGWEILRVASGDAGAQVLVRRLPLGLRLAYVPMGPIGDWLPDLLPDLDTVCRGAGAFALKIEPDGPEDPGLAADLQAHGFRPSPHSIQPRRSLIVDLRGSEEDVLARMHQKTRYNIRLAAKNGVTTRTWDDLATFGQMMQQTAARNGFGAHQPSYYADAFDHFHPLHSCELLLAEHQAQPLAALMVFARGRRAWYLYGASVEAERQRMPTYRLQWEAMRWARARGCTQYDLWGVPDTELPELERDFRSRRDGLWGVYRFKRGFGGELKRGIGAWDRVYRPAPYQAYRLLARWRRMEG